jgi:hypothetical protein
MDRILGCGGSLGAAHEAGQAVFLATPTDPSARVEPDFLGRPWKWLAAVAEAALAEGHWGVGAKIALVCHLWNHAIIATDPGVQMGSLVSTPPEIEARIYRAGVGCLRNLPSRHRLFADAGGEFLAGDAQSRLEGQLTQMAARRSPISHEPILPVEPTRHVQEKTVTVDDPGSDKSSAPDAEWLRDGEQRYERLVARHYGSPETIAAGGHARRQVGDLAAALFFFQKAIDLLHTLYDFSAMKDRRPSEADGPIVDAYLAALAEVRRLHPQAAVAASVKEVTHRLRTISTACRETGIDSHPYLVGLDRLGEIAPDVDVSGIFWKNPSLGEALGDQFPFHREGPDRP